MMAPMNFRDELAHDAAPTEVLEMPAGARPRGER